jgi:predicted DNA binding protein
MNKAVNDNGTYLTLDLWHPNCWAINSTERLPGGVLAHAIYDDPSIGSQSVNGVFTAFGETEDEVEALLDEIESSPLTGTLNELQTRFDTRRRQIAPGAVSREFFLEYDPNDMICPQLLQHGFVHSSPGRIENGRESWDVCYAGDREEIEPKIEDICDQTGADINITRIRSTDAGTEQTRVLDRLTSSQREVFELARERGYYEWPREVSTRELADELDIAKTTLLEHLRKAEAQLLDF